MCVCVLRGDGWGQRSRCLRPAQPQMFESISWSVAAVQYVSY